MRLWHSSVVFSLSLVLGMSLGGGCAASNPAEPGTGGAVTSTTTSNGGTSAGGSGTGTISTMADASTDGFGECARFSAEAKQAPAAMLIVLDRSASMGQGGKWQAAQLATVQAIDQDAFDSMSIGMMAFPGGQVGAPQCISFLTPQVACGYPGLPDVPISLAGADKSTASQGVRHQIYNWLVGHVTEADPFDASPSYDALDSAYKALKTVNVDKRIVVMITDGGFGCTSLSNRTGSAFSDGLCPDWENPDTTNSLISAARTDVNKPINTFIVGVPGSNSHGEQQGSYATAPYSMRLALSTYAVSGSPETVDPTCDKSAVFTPSGADPAHPCHIDLSANANFNADSLANAITSIRGKALGCVYDLPTPPSGETIDSGHVNVVVTVDGAEQSIPKRANASDTCATEPCWDYNSKGQVELIGVTCENVSKAKSASVKIYVGCATILK